MDTPNQTPSTAIHPFLAHAMMLSHQRPRLGGLHSAWARLGLSIYDMRELQRDICTGLAGIEHTHRHNIRDALYTLGADCIRIATDTSLGTNFYRAVEAEVMEAIQTRNPLANFEDALGMIIEGIEAFGAEIRRNRKEPVVSALRLELARVAAMALLAYIDLQLAPAERPEHGLGY
jgi:hypothetical protein